MGWWAGSGSGAASSSALAAFNASVCLCERRLGESGAQHLDPRGQALVAGRHAGPVRARRQRQAWGCAWLEWYAAPTIITPGRRYDGTVRNAVGEVIQFLYGEDGMEGTAIEGQRIDFLRWNKRKFAGGCVHVAGVPGEAGS